MSLRYQLRADDDLKLALCDRIEFAPEPFGAAGKIRRQHDPPRIGKNFGDFLRNAFDTRSTGGQALLRTACGACIGFALKMAAMMAHQRAAKTMFNQPSRAIRTLEAMTAIAAQR